MNRARTRTTTMYSIEIDGKEYATNFLADDNHELLVRPLPDGRTVVGYLSHQDDCENPLTSCDGMGEIIDRRNRRREDEVRVLTAMGADGYARKPNPYAVLLDVYSHSGDCWRVLGSGKHFPDEQWDVSNGAGLWLPDPSTLDHIKASGVRGLLPAGTETTSKHDKETGKSIITCTFPVLASVSDTAGATIPYTVTGLKTFEATYKEACRILGIEINAESRKRGRRNEAVRCAQSAVDEYNKWLSGDCYGVCVDVLDAHGEIDDELSSAVWSFIGSKYAEEELRGEVDAMVEHLTHKDEGSDEKSD